MDYTLFHKVGYLFPETILLNKSIELSTSLDYCSDNNVGAVLRDHIIILLFGNLGQLQPFVNVRDKA